MIKYPAKSYQSDYLSLIYVNFYCSGNPGICNSSHKSTHLSDKVSGSDLTLSSLSAAILLVS